MVRALVFLISVSLHAQTLLPSPIAGSGGGGSAAFNTITSGTNTTAAMVVGSGGSLTVSGTGTINATALNGTAFAGTSGNLVSFGAANIPADSGIASATVVKGAAAVGGSANLVSCAASAGTLKDCTQALLPLGSSGAVGLVFSGDAAGWYRNASNQWTFQAGGTSRLSLFDSVVRIGNIPIGWSGGDSESSADAGASRVFAGVLGIGNGTQGDVSGSLKFTQTIAAGSGPTVGAGSCTGATIGTGSTQMTGTITGTPTGTCTVTLTFPVAATTGYSCAISNQTTANLIRQTASSTTVATFVGVTVANDVLRYGPCIAY